MVRHLIVKSRKQHIRLWFEFYKLAYEDLSLRDNLAKVRTFYEPWGDPRGVKFDDWWKDHANLFGTNRVDVASKISKTSNMLTVNIPLNIPVSLALADVKLLIEAKQSERLIELGLDPQSSKSRRAAFGKYEVNAKELRGRPLHESLVLYQIWLGQGKPKVNSTFMQTVRDTLRNRPKAKWVPAFLLQEADVDRKGNLRFTEEQIRQMRRSIKKASNVCLAVSKGMFPNLERR
jgi:hypothetical protein